MTSPDRVHLCTVAACHLRDGRRGGPGRIRIPGVRDFRKGVPALGRWRRGLAAFAAALRRPRNHAVEEPA